MSEPTVAPVAPPDETTAPVSPAAPVPSVTWRRAAVGVVVAADVVVVLAGGSAIAGFVPFSAPAVAVATLVAVRRPGGWGALALLLVQVLAATVPWGIPDTLVDWALAAATGVAVVSTHLALALLAAWPVRAGLPRATLARWLRQGAALSLVAVGAAGIGAAASATPSSWGPFVGTAALLALSALAWTVRLATKRR